MLSAKSKLFTWHANSHAGVTDGHGTDARLEIQGVASWSLAELAGVHEGTLPELFG